MNSKKKVYLAIALLIIVSLITMEFLLIIYNRSYAEWLVKTTIDNEEPWFIAKIKLKMANIIDRKAGDAAFWLSIGYANHKNYDCAYRYYKIAYERKHPLAKKEIMDALKKKSSGKE
ncbi:MAG: hypothetical protein GYA51_15395 [Candidatus Methanofastidiosa archaeon]|nr:hypothetical protein [Candidatus Methanofastidiosa archaeon]